MDNFSFYSIPAYWVLSLIPHSYAISVITKANGGKWSNVSPRSTTWDGHLRKTIPADIYARYERSEAASKNGFENLPIFVGAVLAGNLAKLGAREMNVFVGSYLALRVLYTLCYVNISKNWLSYARSVAWITGTLLCMRIFVKAGLALNAA
ncbi:hypothetical protein BGZ60DRAFT_157765 [Tricladium varicosporioides]|nr:hypothetical protein BGZ60DRAFT_157765 [Hymenoscyphus varicosporioides]